VARAAAAGSAAAAPTASAPPEARPVALPAVRAIRAVVGTTSRTTTTSRLAALGEGEAPRPKQFIAEQQENWKKVRVFDSTVDLLR